MSASLTVSNTGNLENVVMMMIFFICYRVRKEDPSGCTIVLSADEFNRIRVRFGFYELFGLSYWKNF